MNGGRKEQIKQGLVGWLKKENNGIIRKPENSLILHQQIKVILFYPVEGLEHLSSSTDTILVNNYFYGK